MIIELMRSTKIREKLFENAEMEDKMKEDKE
jgi:hypothetical protein